MSLNTIAAGASPLALFRDYLQRGELAYQFDAASGQPVDSKKALLSTRSKATIAS